MLAAASTSKGLIFPIFLTLCRLGACRTLHCNLGVPAGPRASGTEGLCYPCEPTRQQMTLVPGALMRKMPKLTREWPALQALTLPHQPSVLEHELRGRTLSCGLGRERCLAASIALGAEDLLQTLPSRISTGRNIHGEECPLRGLAWFLGLCFACWWAAPELGVSRRFPVHARPPALRGAAPHRCHRQMELPEHSWELSSGPWTLLFLLGQHRRWVCRDTWKSARSSVRSSRNRPRRAFPLQHLYCYRSFFCHET